MDEMKLNLGSKFMRKVASKLIAKYIRKTFGYKIDIDLNALNVKYVDGDAVIKTDVELRIDKHEFKKLISKVDVDEF